MFYIYLFFLSKVLESIVKNVDIVCDCDEAQCITATWRGLVETREGCMAEYVWRMVQYACGTKTQGPASGLTMTHSISLQ